jgi:hypothetical protein
LNTSLPILPNPLIPIFSDILPPFINIFMNFY